MWVSEQLIFACARALYKTDIAQNPQQIQAMQSRDDYDTYRFAGLDRILEKARSFGIDINGSTVLDLGCNDGAISEGFLARGARNVIGVDIDAAAIDRAQQKRAQPGVTFVLSTPNHIPLDNECVDFVVSSSAFEHIAQPDIVLKELRRVLKPQGKILIGTNGWYHPFAPHLWATMPVPWVHVFFSERTILRVCRRVYHAPWYVPNMLDFDADGKRLPDKYTHEQISTEYLNKFLIKDFEEVFAATGFSCKTHLVPFGASYARFTRVFMNLPIFREFFTGHVWFELSKASHS